MIAAATIHYPVLKRFIAPALALGCLLGLAAPRTAGAAVATFSWLLPAGGETWTMGATHTVEWVGGSPSSSVTLYLIRISPPQAIGAFALAIPNSGAASWTIPSNLTPGAYQLYIEDVPLTTWTYGPIFTVQSGPNCGNGGVVTAVSFPFTQPPTGVCGQTAADALAAAQAYTQNLLATACPNGYYQDLSTAIFDLTILPVGVCYSGYTGAYVAEGSAVVCCYPNPVPAESSTWGKIKALYR